MEKLVPVHTRLEPHVVTKLRKIAKQKEWTLSQLVRRILADYPLVNGTWRKL